MSRSLISRWTLDIRLLVCLLLIIRHGYKSFWRCPRAATFVRKLTTVDHNFDHNAAGRLKILVYFGGHVSVKSSPERRLWTFFARKCPRQESNLRTWLRRPMLYPLSYEDSALHSTTIVKQVAIVHSPKLACDADVAFQHQHAPACADW